MAAVNFWGVLFLFLLPTFCTGSKLVLVQVLYRHGQRTPTEFYPNNTHQNEWKEGLGQLTNAGKMNEFKLGQFLRQKYIDNGFMDKNLNHSLLYVRSTDVDRTLESAQLVLAGLYPPSPENVWNKNLNWQPIPIHTIPRKQDNLLQYSGTDCPKFWQENSKAFKVDPLKSVIDKYQDLFDYLSVNSGMKITFNNAWIIHDDTLNEMIHNMSIPVWILNKWPKIVEESNLNFGLFVPSAQMKRLKGGPLVKDMIQHMDDHISEKSPVKMYQYSAHDTTVGIWLTVMGLFNGLMPGYSSAIMVELHHINVTSKTDEDFGVKILYRNDTSKPPVTLSLLGCPEICPLNKFKMLTSHIIPDDVNKECQIASPMDDSSGATFKFNVFILLASYLIAAMLK